MVKENEIGQIRLNIATGENLTTKENGMGFLDKNYYSHFFKFFFLDYFILSPYLYNIIYDTQGIFIYVIL